MSKTKKGRKDGISLAKGPIAIVGIALLAYGILNFIFGGNGFTAKPIDGTVNGDKFLGIEANGWTNVLIAGSGLLLLFGSPSHAGAKTLAIIVGLVLGAASVISMSDGDDVFGIFATNGLTQLALGAAATALLILALLPRVGKNKDKDKDRHVARDRPRDHDRVEDVDRVRDREFERGRETGRREALELERTDRTHGTDRVETSGRGERPDRFEREPVSREQGHVEHVGSDERRVVAPADGDGVEDRGSETFDRRDRT